MEGKAKKKGSEKGAFDVKQPNPPLPQIQFRCYDLNP